MSDSRSAKVELAALLGLGAGVFDDRATKKILSILRDDSSRAVSEEIEQLLRECAGDDGALPLITRIATVLIDSADDGGAELLDRVRRVTSTSTGELTSAHPHPDHPGFDETAPAAPAQSRSHDEGNPNPDSGRFQKIRPHAKGGLGEVSLARDKELNREVALKEIRPQFSDDETSRARFLLEAEVTGGLEHPGIVPVYGLGRYADGQPYYAMRFIRGDSLKEAIHEFHRQTAGPDFQSLEFRQLLSRFLDVCNAIEYAHSRGILHRDLKPGNIMLGKYGETLVVDWGLAKVKDEPGETAPQTSSRLQPASGSVATQLGSTIGTPAFMPPEQARGDLNSLGPQSDVYSLGATLYCLLVGAPPIDGESLAEILNNVQAGRITPPVKVHSGTPQALSAICMKSLALTPGERFQSPKQLAEDIECFLADEPVSAHQEPVLARGRRWVRKHPAISSTVAAVVLLSIVGLAAFSTVVGSKNQQLTALNLGLDAKNKELAEANAREVDLRRAAQTNEQLAKEQSALAIVTLRQVLGDVQGGLRNTPGGSEVRRRILSTSLENLNQIAVEFIKDAAVDETTIQVLLDMGEVIFKFTATEITGGESSMTVAERFFRQARDAARERLDDPNFARLHSIAIEKLGEVRLSRGEIKEAIGEFERVLEFRETMATEHPTAESYRDLSVILNNLGNAYTDDRQFDTAIMTLDRARDIRLAAYEKTPHDKEAVSDLANVGERLAHAYLVRGDLIAAVRHYEASTKLRMEALALDDHDARTRRGVAFAQVSLAPVYLRMGRTTKAEETARLGRQLAGELLQEEPNSLEVRRAFQRATAALGEALLRSGQISSAAPLLKESRDLAQQAAKDDPRNKDWMQEYLGASLLFAEVLEQLQKREEALTVLLSARERAIESAKSDSKGISPLLLTSLTSRCALLEHELGDAKAGITGMESALEMARDAIRDGEPSKDARRVKASCLGLLGLMYVNSNRLDDARRILEENVETARTDAADLADPLLRRDYGLALSRLAEVSIAKMELPASIAKLQESLAVYEQILEDDESSDLRELVVSSNKRLGEVLRADGKLADALSAFSNAVHLRSAMVEQESTNPVWLRDVASISETIAEIQRDLNYYPQAIEAVTRAVQIRERLDRRDGAGVARARELTHSLDLWTGILIKAARGDESLNVARRRLAKSEKDLARFPSELELKTEIAIGHIRVAAAFEATEGFEEAARSYARAIEILNALERKGELAPEAVGWAARLEGLRGRSSIKHLASQSLDQIEKAPMQQRLGAALERVRRQAKAGDVSNADKTLERWSEWVPAEPGPLYNLACGHAIVHAAAKRAEIPGLDVRADRAIDALKRAIDAGWKRSDHIRKDTDLDSLRDFPAFKALTHPAIEAEKGAP